MNRAVGFIVAAVLAGSACGDNGGPSGLSDDQLLGKLRALPGVKAEEGVTGQDGVTSYILHFTQPIDHRDPSLGTFQQEVSLLHRSELPPVPMIVQTSGYRDDYQAMSVELTNLLDANQVSIEHRYFGTSRPVPTDWSKLTIWQAAADEHDIIGALRTIYGGAFLTTGGSKGGMTAVFHRKYYPADVEGTVAYVAPISFGAPDTRYPAFFDTVGNEDCRNAVRALATDMLVNRRDEFEARARMQTENTYTRVAIGPAVEAAIAGFEWAFWQYFGVDFCRMLPEVTADGGTVFTFLDKVSPIHDSADGWLAEMEAYYYQSYTELGYPDYSVPYLTPYLRYTEADYRRELPVAEASFVPDRMPEILDFVDLSGDRFLFIYGEWDPWTEGRVVLGMASDSNSFVQSEGTHSAHITGLKESECATALSMIEKWTGVTPRLGWWRRAGSGGNVEPPQAPRMRPVLHGTAGATAAGR